MLVALARTGCGGGAAASPAATAATAGPPPAAGDCAFGTGTGATAGAAHALTVVLSGSVSLPVSSQGGNLDLLALGSESTPRKETVPPTCTCTIRTSEHNGSNILHHITSNAPDLKPRPHLRIRETTGNRGRRRRVRHTRVIEGLI